MKNYKAVLAGSMEGRGLIVADPADVKTGRKGHVCR